ncbi:MAG TPA: hypothetical protein VFB38_22605 [Chthonomonadaceae bacterium]|nr:hypothetical protein [Chthonomonadaceae bacterium]
MPAGEIPITCPHCQHRTSLPVAAVKRDNYYCSRCLQKIPMQGIRAYSDPTEDRPYAARPKKSSRGYRK